MKVEKSFTIDGKVVTQVFKSSDITVYEHESKAIDQSLYFFVNTKTEQVMFRQKVEADMEQGCGFISNVEFKELT